MDDFLANLTRKYGVKPEEEAKPGFWADMKPRPALGQAQLEAAFQGAAKAAEVEKRPRPPKLSDRDRLVAMQRKWALAFPAGSMPEDMGVLSRVIPSGLKEREVKQFLYSSLEEARHRFLVIYNTSWTKAGLWSRAKQEGVHNALEVLEPRVRKELKKGIRFLSD